MEGLEPGADPCSGLEARIWADQVEKLLPSKDRRIFAMIRADATEADMAEQLGLSVGAVKSRRHRLMEKLRQLEGRGGGLSKKA